MSKPVEVFKNEEAAKFLNYFVAYKKLMRTIEQIKCIAALNSEIRFSENQPETEKNTLQKNDNQPAISLATAHDK